MTKKEVMKIYNKLVKLSKKNFAKDNSTNSLKYIVAASNWMYNFNILYTDYDLESLLSQIAEKSIPKLVVPSTNKEKVVFIDYFGLDNRGLTQQYLRGLMKLGKHILYILHNTNPITNSEIIRELRAYDKAEIRVFVYSIDSMVEEAKNISNAIADFAPQDVLIHMAPWDVVTLLAIHSINGPIKYNINLTDHAFWLGASFFDYNLEFRGYGEVLSLQKRNFKKEQLINIPYYPIVSKYTSFNGFPKLPKDSVIILCGGSEYKMLGKNGIFFKLMDEVLDLSSAAHILVAGIGDNSRFAENVKDMRNGERIHLLGNRKDINEVFAHSDIYLSSYPFIGGLMTQFAAYNKLPILSYGEPEEVGTVESLINHFGESVHTRRSLEDFKAYAKNLLQNRAFRINEGIQCHETMVDEAKFVQLFRDVLNNHSTPLKNQVEQPDYIYMANYYLEVENINHAALTSLLLQLRFKTFFLFPIHFPICCKISIKKIIRKFLFLIKDINSIHRWQI